MHRQRCSSRCFVDHRHDVLETCRPSKRGNASLATRYKKRLLAHPSGEGVSPQGRQGSGAATVLYARHRWSARTWPGYSLTTPQGWSLARLKRFRAGWSRDERDLLSQNTVAVGCAEGGAPIHAMAGRAAGDGALELRAAAHGLYIPTFNRRCMETKEVGRKRV
jgi:hypothetical protein